MPGRLELAEVAALATAVAVPHDVLYRPDGPSVAEVGRAGARRISTGSLLVRVALDAITRVARSLRDGEDPGLTPTGGPR